MCGDDDIPTLECYTCVNSDGDSTCEDDPDSYTPVATTDCQLGASQCCFIQRRDLRDDVGEVPGLRVCPLSSIYWLVILKLLIIEIEKRHNKMVDRIRYPTVSYLPFYYVFFQFLLLTIFNLQANILTTKDILSNLGEVASRKNV